jgi:branched-chain amino acid transport system ATP-binding protein
MLEVDNIHSFYGHIEALQGVSLHVKHKEIVTIIGANGAGKSTLLMTICGKPTARYGKILFNHQDITTLKTHDIMRLGIACSPEGRRIFADMTVLENLQLGAILSPKAYFAQDMEKVLTLFPRLKERLKQVGGTLSGGEQQMLAIARALLARPTMLLLDEPSLGLAPLVARQIFEALRTVNIQESLSILLVEQNAFAALKLAHRGYVLANGRITETNDAKVLLSSPAIKAAYLDG